MNQNILFIGMDVHKESIEIAIAEGDTTEVRRYGKIGGTHDVMRKILRKLALRWVKHCISVTKPAPVAMSCTDI